MEAVRNLIWEMSVLLILLMAIRFFIFVLSYL